MTTAFKARATAKPKLVEGAYRMIDINECAGEVLGPTDTTRSPGRRSHSSPLSATASYPRHRFKPGLAWPGQRIKRATLKVVVFTTILTVAVGALLTAARTGVWAKEPGTAG